MQDNSMALNMCGSLTNCYSIKKNKKTGAKYSFDSGLLLQKMITLRLRTAEPGYGNSW